MSSVAGAAPIKYNVPFEIVPQVSVSAPTVQNTAPAATTPAADPFAAMNQAPMDMFAPAASQQPAAAPMDPLQQPAAMDMSAGMSSMPPAMDMNAMNMGIPPAGPAPTAGLNYMA